MLNPTDQDKRHGATRIEPSVDGTFLSKYPAGGKPVASSSHAALRATHSGSGSSSGGATGDWVMFSTNPEYAPLAMYPLYPRPDAETSASSYHRKAHTGRIYKIPIGVQGGGWPFRYEIISGPTGATIGEELIRSVDGPTGYVLHEPDPDYGVLSWDPSAESQLSNHNFHVRVTDQQGNSVDFQWSVQVDDDAFRFLNSSTGNDANAGTQAAPLQTFANGLWKNSDSDSTYAGKIAVFEGTFDINAGTTPSAPVFSSNDKPSAYVAGPSGATFNLANGNFRCTSAVSDKAFVGITFTGSRTDLANNYLIYVNGTGSRLLFHDLSFTTHGYGTTGNDNPGCIVFWGVAGTHSNNYVVGCDISSGTQMCLTKTFNSNYFLVEDCHATNANIVAPNGGDFVQVKDDTSNATVRNSSFTGSAITSAFNFSNQNTEPSVIENQELCFCRAVYDGDQDVDPAMYWNEAGNAENAHYYRCSVTSQRRSHRFLSTANPVTWSGTAYSGPIQGDNYTEPYQANVSLTAGDFDSAGKLTGSARATHLLTIGAEIATEA